MCACVDAHVCVQQNNTHCHVTEKDLCYKHHILYSLAMFSIMILVIVLSKLSVCAISIATVLLSIFE
jgi:hypothetical protein